MRVMRLVGVAGLISAACHPARAPREVVPRTDWSAAACDIPAPATFRGAGGALSATTRDSLLRDLEARRAAWRERHITTYRLRIAETCFCPGSPPGVVEVRNGIVVATLDTAGRSPPGQLARWASYTVEALFDAVERTLRDGNLLEVSYDACLGYPTAIRGNMRMVDTWFQIAAGPLTQPR